MPTKKTHWPSILILIVLSIGILFFLGIAFIMSIASATSLIDNSSAPADNMIIAFSAGLEFVLLLACSWFILQKTLGQESSDDLSQFPFEGWQVWVIPLIVIASISIGGGVAIYANQYLNWFILPMATLLVIVLPIFLFVGIGTRGIEIGPRWRTWGTIGMGLTINPAIMIVLELAIFVAGLVAVGVILSFQPGKLQEFRSFFQLLNHQASEETAFTLITPYLSDPRVIASIFGYISLIVPLIEEMLKPLAVWLFARSIEKPSQGFVLGMLSGGAFAIVESLNASADSSASWPVVVGVRAGASLLHITLTGLMGYAIVGAFKEKKIGQLFLTYFTVVAIHGLWNACAIGASLAANGEQIGKPEWLTTYLPASISGIVVLSIGMLIVVIASNRRIRSGMVPVPVEDKE